ncbi:MAG: hypothetical protein JWN99_148 [Ilumatobacteraceae bacterium]|nr:hypothetical protein [Ilumatobacteraceae bacterium]
MAAEVLARAGAEVTVHEHMPSVGRKLLLAGRGGLNITHSEPVQQLLTRYGVGSQRLEPALRAFGPAELRAWCAGQGEATFVGSSGRVFPASFRATPLLRAWLTNLRELGVQFVLRDRWLGWGTTADGTIDARTSLFSTSGQPARAVRSDVTVLALGGASWPRVGSDGGWVERVRSAGVDVRDLRPANCGVRVAWTATFVDRFAGTPLKNVSVRMGDVAVRGDATVTTDGLEGGPVYAHSSTVRDAIDLDGRCAITIDMHPDLTAQALAERLAQRRPKDSVATWLRRSIGLSPVAIALLREAAGGALPHDPAVMAMMVKAVRIDVRAVMPIGRAISSAGGIALTEVDEQFMLRPLPGTFVAGEMLDWDAPTGGYLLQASFSTAVDSANGAAAWLAWVI